MVLTSRIALVFALVFATGCGEKAQDAADKAKEVAGAAGEKAKVAGEKAVDGAKKAMAGAQGGLTAIAAEQKTSASAIVRNAIDDYIDRKGAA